MTNSNLNIKSMMVNGIKFYSKARDKANSYELMSFYNLSFTVKLVAFTYFLFSAFTVFSQNTTTPKLDNPSSLTLPQCISYAMQHQPNLQKSLLNIEVAKATIAINKSGLLPQVGATANFTNYISLPTTISSTTSKPVKTGVLNTLIPGIAVTQAIYSPALKYATAAAPILQKQAEQSTDSVKIELVAAVSKTFYSLLLTLQQIDILKEDTLRLGQNLRDSYHKYLSGIVDETDYEQATISLNNSVASLRQATENIQPQYAVLKQLIGYPSANQFNISFDTAQMTKEIEFDTTSALKIDNRIEIKQLALSKDLQHQVTNYYENQALPTFSAFFNYNFEFENNQFSKLYNNIYPYSYIGLSASVPIFTGFARVQGVNRSKIQERQLEWTSSDLQAQINTQYSTALANYKSNLNNYQTLEKNKALAKRVYFVVNLQYKQGIVAYLNVINAESNLINAEISSLNALFQVLSSKIDLEKAEGVIKY